MMLIVFKVGVLIVDVVVFQDVDCDVDVHGAVDDDSSVILVTMLWVLMML